MLPTTSYAASPRRTRQFGSRWLTQRDRHLHTIKEHSRLSWQAASGYNWCTLVKADVSRLERVAMRLMYRRTSGSIFAAL